jgi:hypothetical protein
MLKPGITFVAAVNDRRVLEDNLLSSPCFRNRHGHEILIQEGFNSAARAYNDALDRSRNDLIVFIHQDMILPEPWLGELENSLAFLETHDPAWGVLGCYGETQRSGGRGCVYQSGLGMVGAPIEKPTPIQTLDEIVLILRKSSGLRFDESLPHFHLYGTDICLRAAQQGRKSYAIPAFCVHNTNQGFILPKEFYACYRQVHRTWRAELPIRSSCIPITRLNLAMYRRRLQEFYYRHVRPDRTEATRIHDVAGLLQDVERAAGPSLAPLRNPRFEIKEKCQP